MSLQDILVEDVNIARKRESHICIRDLHIILFTITGI